MKQLLVVALMFIIASCTKQASVPMEQLASKANHGRGKPSTESTLSLETLSNPSPNTLQWTLPALTGTEAYYWTVVEWGTDSSGSFQKISGIPFYKSPITEYINGSTSATYSIPSGTWSVRISGLIATPNPLAGTMFLLGDTWVWQPDFINDRIWQTNVLTGVTIN